MSSYNTIDFQSSSIKRLTLGGNGAVSVSQLNGTPEYVNILPTATIGTFKPGATGYGRTREITANSAAITTFTPTGITYKGPGNVGVNVACSMSNGVIRIDHSEGPMTWAVPGSTCFWSGAYFTETAFRIVDVTEDATYTYVHTDLAGSFPPVATNGGALYIQTHPAPRASFTNCTGAAKVVDLSGAPAGRPLHSYSSKTYTGNTIGASADIFVLWGKLVSVNVNVTQAYTGTAPSLLLHLFGQFHASGLDAPDYSSNTAWNPKVDLKTTGLRTITPTAVTTASINDDLSAPGRVWLSDAQQVYATADVSGEASNKWPIVSIEVQTDQGITSGFVLPLALRLHA